MRFVRFLEGGKVRLGVVQGEEVVDIPMLGSTVPATLLDVIRSGARQNIERLVASAPARARKSLAGLTYALPIDNPGKIVCLGLNYAAHAEEGGYATPGYPALFLRVATSLTPHRAPMVRPSVSEQFDFEAELMVVIGKTCRNLKPESALDAVFGYTLFNDGSIRDYQRKSAQWTAGKNFDATGAIGPWVATSDELPAGAAGLGIRSTLNGKLMQNSNTERMIFDVRKTLTLLSEIMTLEPGDLIAMGTPDGVGNARKPPVWLKPGDTIEVEIDGLGKLSNPVVADVAR